MSNFRRHKHAHAQRLPYMLASYVGYVTWLYFFLYFLSKHLSIVLHISSGSPARGTIVG